MKMASFMVILGLVLGFFPVAPGLALTEKVASSGRFFAGIEGQVTEQEFGQPIPGASITSPDLGLKLVTDQAGHFTRNDLLIKQPVLPVTVTVAAKGYEIWILRNVKMVSNDKLILDPMLSKKASQVTEPVSSLARKGNLAVKAIIPKKEVQETLKSDVVLPETIRVRMTGQLSCSLTVSYTVKTVDFKSYVKHVLPGEWDPLSRAYPDALRAGAMAIKMYAWYWIERGGKWSDADVYDSVCDQVYNPSIAYESTNKAVDYTWGWTMTRDDQIFQAYHLQSCNPPRCMGQRESLKKAIEGLTWDEIIEYFYPGSTLKPLYTPPAGFALQFNGSPGDSGKTNRVEIPVGVLTTTQVSPPVNIGARDFTLEWWMKASEWENTAGEMACGKNQNWIYGNILFDRYQVHPGGKYGISLQGGKITIGITGEDDQSLSLCGKTIITDNQWHHIAVQRQREDGYVGLFVDGILDAAGRGPVGDISYSPYESPVEPGDAFLSIGAWKLDSGSLSHPFFRGWLDEIRFSSIVRYPSSGFTPPEKSFTPDEATIALYHFDEGIGDLIVDSSGNPEGSSPGVRLYGGLIRGPEWMPSSLFLPPLKYLYLPESLNLKYNGFNPFAMKPSIRR